MLTFSSVFVDEYVVVVLFLQLVDLRAADPSAHNPARLTQLILVCRGLLPLISDKTLADNSRVAGAVGLLVEVGAVLQQRCSHRFLHVAGVSSSSAVDDGEKPFQHDFYYWDSLLRISTSASSSVFLGPKEAVEPLKSFDFLAKFKLGPENLAKLYKALTEDINERSPGASFQTVSASFVGTLHLFGMKALLRKCRPTSLARDFETV